MLSDICNYEYKLHIKTQKLQSKILQVKFVAILSDGKNLSDYLLITSKEILKSVVIKIRNKLSKLGDFTEEGHAHSEDQVANATQQQDFVILKV